QPPPAPDSPSTGTLKAASLAIPRRRSASMCRCKRSPPRPTTTETMVPSAAPKPHRRVENPRPLLAELKCDQPLESLPSILCALCVKDFDLESQPEEFATPNGHSRLLQARI